MTLLVEPTSEMSAKERYLQELDAQIVAAEAQHARLTATNNEVAAALRVQAMVDARQDAALEVEAERAQIAIERQQLEQDRQAAAQDRVAQAQKLAEINASADQQIRARLQAAHQAALDQLHRGY